MVCRYILAAGAFRSFGNMVVSCYLPVFFQKVYPAFTSEYSIVSAISLTTLGFSSVLLGGIIGDKYSKKYSRTNSLICMLGALVAIPLIGAGTLFHSNFWFSVSAASLSILFSGSYFAPAITMMQNSSTPENTGNVVSVYTFVTCIAQTISPLIFNALAYKIGA